MERWIMDTIFVSLAVIIIAALVGTVVFILATDPFTLLPVAILGLVILSVSAVRLSIIWLARTFGDGPKYNPYPWEETNE